MTPPLKKVLQAAALAATVNAPAWAVESQANDTTLLASNILALDACLDDRHEDATTSAKYGWLTKLQGKDGIAFIRYNNPPGFKLSGRWSDQFLINPKGKLEVKVGWDEITNNRILDRAFLLSKEFFKENC